jgi:hypothetical protein
MPGLESHGWYDSDWKFRMPIVVDVSTSSGAGFYGFTLTIPKDFDLFWAGVATDGFDMVLTMADGMTELTDSSTYWDTGGTYGWDRANAAGTAWSKTTRTGGIRASRLKSAAIASLLPLVDSTYSIIYLYWGKTGESTHAIGSYGAGSLTARIDNMHPSRCKPRILTRPELPTATQPRQRIALTTAETQDLFWDFSKEMIGRRSTYEGKVYADAIRCFTFSASTGGGASSTDVANHGRAIGMSGAILATRITGAGSSSGTTHTEILTATTCSGRVLNRRALVNVRDPADT